MEMNQNRCASDSGPPDAEISLPAKIKGGRKWHKTFGRTQSAEHFSTIGAEIKTEIEFWSLDLNADRDCDDGHVYRTRYFKD